jgi:hypothetical protein
MALVGRLGVILEWAEDGEVLEVGPTDMGLGGDGVVTCGEALALVPGALITNVVMAASSSFLCPYY